MKSDPPVDLKSWRHLHSFDMLRLQKAVHGLIKRTFAIAINILLLQMNPCIWVLPSSVSVSRDDPRDVLSRLRAGLCKSHVQHTILRVKQRRIACCAAVGSCW